MGRRLIAIGVGAVATAAFALTIVALFAGGTNLRLTGIRFSAHNPARPFFVAADCAAGLLLLLKPRWRERFEALARVVDGRRVRALAGALATAVMVLIASIRYGSFVAAASDSYGYVTEAELLSSGSVRLPQIDLAAWPWPDAAGTFTPVAYRPSADGRSMVPTYPPGFPLLMAAAHVLIAPAAKYLVVPVASAFVVVCTFLVGQQVAGSATGLLSALLLSVSPAFLFHSFAPMSDVPATAAFTFALLMCFACTRGAWLAGGCSAGLGVLIRPSLLPLLIALAAMLAIRARPMLGVAWWRAPLLFGAAAMPAIVLLGWLNAMWYGSPLESGYGELGNLYSLHHLTNTARAYPRWLLDTQTVFVFLGLAAPFALRPSMFPSSPLQPSRELSRSDASLLLAFAATVAVCYAFYRLFDDWTYLRFLLPAYPALLVTAVAVCLVWLRGLLHYLRPVAGAIVFGTVALACWHQANVRHAFVNWASLERFAEVPRLARDRFPADALYLTRIYSGSMRYYGDRPTLRWDILSPDWLDPAIEALRVRGLTPLIVIESAEEETWFRDRFAARNQWGRLDWPPVMEYVGVEWVRVYDPRDRARFLAGNPVSTHRVASQAARR